MTTHAPAGPPVGSTTRAGRAAGPVTRGSGGTDIDGDLETGPHRRRLGGALGWVFVALELAYVIALHQGIAPAPGGFPTEWWHPTRSWLAVDWIADLLGQPLRASVFAALPAAALAAGVAACTASATARWLALSGVTASLLFGFYGFGPVRVWEFFHWRGSLVIVTIAASLGGALASPWLARSWLARSPAWRAALYLPVVAAVVVLLRHTTGTDEALAFNFSPWPAVTIFGLEIGAYAVIGWLLGIAIGVAGVAEWRRGPVWAIAAVAVGAGWPILWMLARFGSLPDGTTGALVVATCASIALASVTRGPSRAARLRRRAALVALGALLAFVPLFVGRALSTGDYTVTRYVRAQRIIDALHSYYEKRGGYPDELPELVELGYLDSIPRPRVGFDFVNAVAGFEPVKFSYQSLGSSYVLEFEFTEWVQCAYNPPWEDEEEYDDEVASADDGDSEDWDDGQLGEAWSCPESRPELW